MISHRQKLDIFCQDNIFPEPTCFTSHLYLCYVIFHAYKGNNPPSLSFPLLFLLPPSPLPLLSLSLPINFSHMELFGHSVLCSEESCYLIISLLSLQVPSESFSPHPTPLLFATERFPCIVILLSQEQATLFWICAGALSPACAFLFVCGSVSKCS